MNPYQQSSPSISISTRKKPPTLLITLPIELLREIIHHLITISLPPIIISLLSFKSQFTWGSPNNLKPWPNSSILKYRLISKFFDGLILGMVFRIVCVESPERAKKFCELPNVMCFGRRVRSWVLTLEEEGQSSSSSSSSSSLGNNQNNRLISKVGGMVRHLIISWPTVYRCNTSDFQIASNLIEFCSFSNQSSSSRLEQIVLQIKVGRYDEDQYILSQALSKIPSPQLKKARLEIQGYQGLGLAVWTTEPFLQVPKYWFEGLEELVVAQGMCGSVVEIGKLKKLKKIHLSRQMKVGTMGYQDGIKVIEEMVKENKKKREMEMLDENEDDEENWNGDLKNDEKEIIPLQEILLSSSFPESDPPEGWPQNPDPRIKWIQTKEETIPEPPTNDNENLLYTIVSRFFNL